MRNRQYIRGGIVIIISVIVAMMVTLPGLSMKTSAAPYAKDQIRVGLYMNSGKINATVPLVTLQSAGGFTIGTRDGVLNKLDHAESVQFQLDQFRIAAASVSSAEQAQKLHALLKESGYSAAIVKRSLKGAPVFDVRTGSFATKAEADAALAKVKQVVANAGVNSASTQVVGFFRLEVGNAATEAEATAIMHRLQSEGFAADLVYRMVDGKAVYAVWTGEATSADQLTALQTALQQSGAVTAVKPADVSNWYILRQPTIAGSGAADQAAYLIHADGQPVWVNPEGERTTVPEKNGRSYRGDMELRGHNGKLALINELPLEQYLYSVVSAEMSTGWPQEALKAQAVAARTFAVRAGNAYGIANVSDSTMDQVYNGTEYDDIIRAVDATQGEVLVNAGGLIEALYSSNAGGSTADAAEIWGNAVPYLQHRLSPEDQAAEKGKAMWLRIVKENGVVGFVHESYLKSTGTSNDAGLPIYTATETGVNVRRAPFVDNTSNAGIATLSANERVVAFDERIESNPYRWFRGPYSAVDLAAKLNGLSSSTLGGSSLQTLEVSKRGPSGRAIEVQANGKAVPVSYPDAFRSLFNGLPSTLFEIEETGRYTILGADNVTRDTVANPGSVYVVQGGQGTSSVLADKQWFMMNDSKEVRMATQELMYTFTGTGYGHGLGMSQWGARGLAEQGKSYKEILEGYYEGASITKE